MMGSMNLGMSSPFIEAFGIACGAAGSVYAVIERTPDIDSMSNEGEQPEKVAGDICFKGVKFNYPSRPDVPVLQGLDLNIRHGETVALVGSSGCGKSTTVQLIQRFYDPLEGEVGNTYTNIDF
jgi:ABC-type multidrug transport system fused ATPase/permease subunit